MIPHDIMRTISKLSSPTSQVRLRSASKNWRNTSVVQGPVSVATRSSNIVSRVKNVRGLRAILEANVRVVDILKKEPMSVIKAVLKKLKFPIVEKQFVMTAWAGSTVFVKQYVHLPTLDMGTTVITDGKNDDITFFLEENDTQMVNVMLLPTRVVDHRYIERLALLMTTYVLAVGRSVAFALDHNTPDSMEPVFRAARTVGENAMREIALAH